MGINFSIIQCKQQSKLPYFNVLPDGGKRASFQNVCFEQKRSNIEVKHMYPTFNASLQTSDLPHYKPKSLQSATHCGLHPRALITH